MALWAHPGKDITGVIARAEKFAGTFEKVNFDVFQLFIPDSLLRDSVLVTFFAVCSYLEERFITIILNR